MRWLLEKWVNLVIGNACIGDEHRILSSNYALVVIGSICRLVVNDWAIVELQGLRGLFQSKTRWEYHTDISDHSWWRLAAPLSLPSSVKLIQTPVHSLFDVSLADAIVSDLIALVKDLLKFLLGEQLGWVDWISAKFAAHARVLEASRVQALIVSVLGRSMTVRLQLLVVSHWHVLSHCANVQVILRIGFFIEF